MKKNIFIVFFLLVTNLLISQNIDLFDSLYNKGVDKAYKDTSIANNMLVKLQEINNLTNIEIAKLNYLKFKIYDNLRKKNKLKKLLNQNISKIKNYNDVDSILYEGIEFIHDSYTDMGIDLLFKFIELTKNDAEKTNKQYFCKINISEGYRKKREFQKGVNLLYSIIYRNDISNKNITFAYNRLAANYNEWQNPNIKNLLDSVIKYSKLSVKISRENSYKSNLASSLNELGYIYANKLYKYDQAEKYFIEAYQYFIEEKSFRNAINTTINLSGLYLRKGDYKKALKTAEKVINICDIKGNEDAHMRLYLQLAKIYSYNKMYHSAYEFLSIGRNLQEKINNNKTDKTINELAARYDLKIKETQIEKEKQKLRIEIKQKLYTYAILGALILILIISYITITLKSKNILQQKKLADIDKKHLQAISEIKNKELLQAIAKKLSYDDVLLKIKDALKENDKREIINIVNKNINTENSWDSFLLKFTELHPDFFAKLEEQFPNLTKSEKRLCGLLFINFKSKDIANVLNINENSVNKNRQRLRKKLKLKKKCDISAYLISIIK